MKQKNIYFALLLACLVLSGFLGACNKVSPTGVLIAGTGVEDRVKMSNLYFQQHKGDGQYGWTDEDYSFLIGADSHLTTDTGRLAEMFRIGIEHDDMFMVHLGDIADTKAEYYVTLDKLIDTYKDKYIQMYYDTIYDGYTNRYYRKGGDPSNAQTKADIIFPFFPVVGNHDITHNGWALWSDLFHSSFYSFDVEDITANKTDHFIFLDSANGTLGEEQVKLIEEGVLDGPDDDDEYRYTFVFTHTNIFRPSSWQFASTYAREETYYLLEKFTEWKVTAVFMGHVHAWDERMFGDAYYITLDSMSEDNSPDPGDYLIRVTVHTNSDEGIDIEKVHLSYTKKN